MDRGYTLTTKLITAPLADVNAMMKVGARRVATFKGEVLPETTAIVCDRIKVAKVADMLPIRFFEALEQNQLLPTCCRHPENHDITAKVSHPDELAPDIYVFHCTCGRNHKRFMVGSGDSRPWWEVR